MQHHCRPTSKKYKFLPMAINLHKVSRGNAAIMLLTYTKMKGIYFKQIREELYKEDPKPYYSKGKHTKYLRNLETSLTNEGHSINLVKHSKNLKNIKYETLEITSLEAQIRFIKRFPKSIETIAILALGSNVNTRKIQGFYRSLCTCIKLKSLNKNLYYEEAKAANDKRQSTNWTEVEYHFINRYVPRLRTLKELYCLELDEETQGFQKMVNQEKAFPYVNGLRIALSKNLLENPNQGNRVYDSRIPPLFTDRLFPNLRKLRMTTSRSGITIRYPVIQGFKSLQRLEQLTLHFTVKVQNIRFLFEGMLFLSSIVSFDLDIQGINGDEQRLLAEFLSKQTRLVKLYLRVRTTMDLKECKLYNRYLEMICQSLNDKEKLEYLYLDINVWSLQSLSNGLSQLALTNHLKEVQIGVFDDISVSSVDPYTKVEGLCEFIKRHKLSLSKLKVNIEYVKDDEVVDSLVKAIAEMNKLECLYIGFNLKCTEYNKILNKVPKESLKGHPSFEKTCVYLNKTLQKLNKLVHLNIDLNPVIFTNNPHYINSSVIFNALPAMKNLRTVNIVLPCMKKSIMAHPEQASLLFECKGLINIYIRTCSESFTKIADENIEEIEKVREMTHNQRYIKENLTL